MTKYALNLAEDGRILSVTYPQYAAASNPIVDSLPEGDHNDYRYVNGEYVHDPLPKEDAEHIPTTEERIAALEAENAMLMECILEMSEIVYA
jgi:hypothetical protein